MSKTKKIPCRVCGKLFEPCAYCQSHGETFRYRNFACSIECAKIYLKDTEEYRKKQNENTVSDNKVDYVENVIEAENKSSEIDLDKTKRKYNKKKLSDETD